METENQTQDEQNQTLEGNETVVTQNETQAEEMIPKSQLEAYLQQVREEAKAEAKEAYKGIQRTISKKDAIIRGLQSQQQPIPSETSKLMLDELERMANESGDATSVERVRQIKGVADAERQRLERMTQLQRQQETVQNKQQEAVQKIIDAGLDPDDSSFATYFTAFKVDSYSDGDFSPSDKLLNSILASRQKPIEGAKETRVPETEAQLKERLMREIYTANPHLQRPEGASPSGANLTEQRIFDNYNSNPSNPAYADAYNRLRQSKGW
uniref:Capsid protein n=1 Tax=viral metagenome TaxID=1070528 RepID=A0A6M3LMA3_9ZZZZ